MWRTKFDGSQPKALTPSTGSSGQRTNWLVQSVDGRTLVYAGFGERLHTLNVQTGADVDLGINSDAFDIDSTGTRLAYVKYIGIANPLIVSNIDGSNPRTIAPGNYFYEGAQWLPGGQWILSRSMILESPTSAHGGGRVLVNVTTGELVPVRYSATVTEMYIVR